MINCREVVLNGLRIGIDQHSGSIVEMEYPDVGVLLEASSPQRAGILDVAYPIKEFTPLRLASRFSRAKVEKQTGRVIVTWEELTASRNHVKMPEGKVAAQVTITAAPDGRSVIFKCLIENRSKACIPQVLFPDLWGFKPFDGEKDTVLRLMESAPIRPFADCVNRRDGCDFPVGFYFEKGWTQYKNQILTGKQSYGTRLLRWLDFGGCRGGISVFEKSWRKTNKELYTFHGEHEPASLRMAWGHGEDCRIGPGEDWESDEFWVTPHRGGWAKGIEVYRDYVRTQYKESLMPKHIREGIGLQTVWMIEEPETDPGRALFRFADIPRIAEDAKRHGITELCLWGWCHYFTLPILLRTELGSRDEFVKAIGDAKKIGVNVNLFIDVELLDEKFVKHYERESIKKLSGDWSYHSEYVYGLDPSYLRAASVNYFNLYEVTNRQYKAWQDDVRAAFKEWLDLGLVSWGWDWYLVDSPSGQGIIDLVEEIRDVAKRINPESTFCAELRTPDSRGHHCIDYTWKWQDCDCDPFVSVYRAPRLNRNVENSPLEVKKGFISNRFLNVMPRKPDGVNGDSLISAKYACKNNWHTFVKDGMFVAWKSA